MNSLPKKKLPLMRSTIAATKRPVESSSARSIKYASTARTMSVPSKANVRSNINDQPAIDFSVEYWDIDRPIPYEHNPRIMTEEAIQGVMKSLETVGQQRALVVDKDGVVVVGHTMLEAMKRLGWDGVYTKVMVGTAEEVKAYRIADNKLSELNRTDVELLNRELASLDQSGFDISMTGFTREALVDDWNMDSAQEAVDNTKSELVPLRPASRSGESNYEHGALVVNMVLPEWARGRTGIEDQFMEWLRESEEYWKSVWPGFRTAWKET